MQEPAARSTGPEPTHRPIGDALTASPQLFQNPLLDKLSRVPWWAPLVFFTPVIIWLGFVSAGFYGFWAILGAALVGYLLWSLTEYLGHRYLFHTEFPGKIGARLHYLMHGVHHDHPSDPLRLVMPPLMSAPIMLIAFGLITLLFGDTLRYPVLMGFIIAYLGYDMLHYYVHHGHPTSQFMLTMRRIHMLHHFRVPDRWFGVSVPYWDYILGTTGPGGFNSRSPRGQRDGEAGDGQ